MNKILTIEDIKNKIVEEGNFRLIQENDTADSYSVPSGIFVTQFVVGEKSLHISRMEPLSWKDSIKFVRKNNMQSHSTEIGISFDRKNANLEISASRFIPQDIIVINSIDGKKIIGRVAADSKTPSLKFKTNLNTVLECLSIGDCTKDNITNTIIKLMIGETPDKYDLLKYAKPGITMVIEEYIKSLIIYLMAEANKKQEEINNKLKIYEEVRENNGILPNELAEGLEMLKSNTEIHGNRK